MIKTLLMTVFVLFSNVAEAHPQCHTENVYHPGYWNTTHHGSQWVPGFWRAETRCPPPPPRQPVIRVYTPPIFPHSRIYVAPPRIHRPHTHHHRNHHHRNHRPRRR